VAAADPGDRVQCVGIKTGGETQGRRKLVDAARDEESAVCVRDPNLGRPLRRRRRVSDLSLPWEDLAERGWFHPQ